jgi:hypothetical protein
MSLDERLDQLAALLEQDIPLPICAERMGYAAKSTVYALFMIMRKRLGPQAK